MFILNTLIDESDAFHLNNKYEAILLIHTIRMHLV